MPGFGGFRHQFWVYVRNGGLSGPTLKDWTHVVLISRAPSRKRWGSPGVLSWRHLNIGVCHQLCTRFQNPRQSSVFYPCSQVLKFVVPRSASVIASFQRFSGGLKETFPNPTSLVPNLQGTYVWPEHVGNVLPILNRQKSNERCDSQRKKQSCGFRAMFQVVACRM